VGLTPATQTIHYFMGAAMSLSRRDFIRESACGATALLLGASTVRAAWRTQQAPTTQPTSQPGTGRRILILGGTGFLGPAVVEAARARGHTLTLFNRGRTRPNLFPDIEKLRGDRDGQLDALKGRTWDAVVDTSGYVPRIVRDSAELLKDAVKHYTFISSISVYSDLRGPVDEGTPVGKLENEAEEQVTDTSYGPLKALCEQAAERAMPGRVANIRPGLIVGPGDPSGRFTYWPVRVARGGEVLAPNTPQDPVQFIDVRDLGAWIVHVIEQNVTGVFNAVGPQGGMPIGELLESCKRTSGSDAKFTWVPTAFLSKHGVSPWSDLPVWVPPDGDEGGMGTVSAARAIAKGLKFRPVDEVTKATLVWYQEQPPEMQKRLAGLKPEREAEVLAAWHAESK
jgi:2'-hydroxyisoflavone reductase